MRTYLRFALLLAVAAAALVSGARTNASPGTTERVSVDSAGNEGNNNSWAAAISGDGRYVAFHSDATNLVPGDTNGVSDVFVHDRQTGVTERVSVDSAGNEGNGYSSYPDMSADGRYVAFQSSASNLVPGDTGGHCQIFVHDRQTGVTERVSMDSGGREGNGESYMPAISADGRYVAFQSSASNLVPGDTGGHYQIFVHDRQTGVTERVSVDSAGNEGNGESGPPAISGDGRYVAFESLASNLVVGDTNGDSDVFVHDRQTGVTERVSVDSAGNQGNAYSSYAAISADGRYVAFASVASNLVPGGTNIYEHILAHDRQMGITERVSVDSAGNQGNGSSFAPAISADGRYVAFESQASNLVLGDTNGEFCVDVFVHDRQTGVTERVSVDSAGNEGGNWSRYPAISADGRYVAFESWASNLVLADTNGSEDVFLHDRLGIPPTPAPTPAATVETCSPVLPSTYYGRVLIDGQAAQSGDQVTASIGEAQWGSGVVSSGGYTLDIPDHMPTVPPCFEGGTITFKLNGMACTPSAEWASGLHGVDLTCGLAAPPLTTIPTPTPNATLVATPTPVRTPAMLPATGGGGLLDGNGLPRAGVPAAAAVLALTAGAWYATRRWGR